VVSSARLYQDSPKSYYVSRGGHYPTGLMTDSCDLVSLVAWLFSFLSPNLSASLIGFIGWGLCVIPVQPTGSVWGGQKGPVVDAVLLRVLDLRSSG